MKHKIVIEFETADGLSQEQLDRIQEVATDAKVQTESLIDSPDHEPIHYTNLTYFYSNDLSDKIDRHILGVLDE